MKGRLGRMHHPPDSIDQGADVVDSYSQKYDLIR